MGMLTELCQELRNWFDRGHDKWFGEITISDGTIECDGAEIDLLEGQHFRIIGSLLNDGVYPYPTEELKDETFRGSVWSMGIPPSVVALAESIESWLEANADALNGPYQSESFGGYSYTLKSGGGSSGSGSDGPSWRSHFADDLNRWRKL